MVNSTLKEIGEFAKSLFPEGIERERFVIVPLEGKLEVVHLFSGTPIGGHDLEEGETLQSAASELTKIIGSEVKLPTVYS